MTFTGWFYLGLVLAVLAVGALFVLAWQLAYKDGWEDCLDDQRSREYLRSIRSERAAARARERAARPPRLKPAAAGSVPRPRLVVTAAGGLAPVIVPLGAAAIPWRPQPGRTSGTGTERLPKLTDTGEIRAIGAAVVAEIEAQEEAWRAQRSAAFEQELAR